MRSTTSTLVLRAQNLNDCVDLTPDLQRAVSESGIEQGCAVVFCAHTTCSLIINEWEDGVLDDLRARLRALVPPAAYYAHDDLARRTQNLTVDERRNGFAHVAQMLLGGASQLIPVTDGRPALGTWQRPFLVELDEPKERHVHVHVFGS